MSGQGAGLAAHFFGEVLFTTAPVVQVKMNDYYIGR